MLEKHERLTQSTRAHAILKSWNCMRSRFVKVFPTEYREALIRRAALTTKE